MLVSVEERFFRHVNKDGPIHPVLGTKCWLWTGGTNGRYGKLNLEGRTALAHRVAWFLEYGRWPEPCALHRCDVTLCVRYDHLFEGTQDDNMDDRERKGRGGACLFKRYRKQNLIVVPRLTRVSGFSD
jgi:hypothetical protein